MSWKKIIYYSKKDSAVCKFPIMSTKSSRIGGVESGQLHMSETREGIKGFFAPQALKIKQGKKSDGLFVMGKPVIPSKGESVRGTRVSAFRKTCGPFGTREGDTVGFFPTGIFSLNSMDSSKIENLNNSEGYFKYPIKGMQGGVYLQHGEKIPSEFFPSSQGKKISGGNFLNFSSKNFSPRTRYLIKAKSNRNIGENSKEFSPIYEKEFLQHCFFNQCFDKGRLKNFVLWFLKNYGQNKTVKLVEQLKNIGFEYASKAGISLGIDDLKIPYRKSELIFDAEKNTTNTIHQYVRGEITGVERFQRLIDTWHSTSESLKQEVINYFEATDILNPVYMMAFSGARGNISQVRQLVGMRGLMSDPQGQIIDFPIRSNFREGLTLTEYLISSYGARKGIVDTALRTANAGYLTRRLVDVAQHVVISHFDCGTHRGIFLKDMKEGNKTIYSLIQRVVGRILARDLIDTSIIPKDQINPSSGVKKEKDSQKDSTNENGLDLREYPIIAKRNEEITMDLAFSIVKKFDKIFVRSPLTCETNQLICQLCYGWSLGQGSTLVSIGEAVGVVAAQSIGEPGTQLTMRTFHTGGVFSGDISDQIRAPFDAIVEYFTAIPGTLIRTPEGKIAFLTKGEGSFVVKKMDNTVGINSKEFIPKEKNPSDFSPPSSSSETMKKYKIPSFTLLYKRNKQSVNEKEVIAQISTISRKSNATDAAELTIPSEYEGQFFSKSLDFREKFVGDAKLIESTLSQLRNQKNRGGRAEGTGPNFRKKFSDINPINQNEMSSNPFNINYIDKLYEAWNWGYAWILSGKIYELNLRGESCFPKLGDLVNTQSSMNQTQWNLYFNNGPAKMYYPFKERKFGPRAHSNNLSYGQLFNIIQNSPNKENSPANVTIAQPFFFLDLLKIRFQKYGYILTSRNKSYSFENNLFNDKSLGNDLLFRMYEIHPRISDTIEKDKRLTTLQKKQKERGNNTLFHWFPFPSQTSTGGFILFEKVFKNHIKENSHNFIRHDLKKQKTYNPLLKPSSVADSQIPQKNSITPTKNIQFMENLNTESPKVDSQIPLLRSGCEQSPIYSNIREKFSTKIFPRSKFFEENISFGDVASSHPSKQVPIITKKQSFSSSLKADFIKKLKMELNAEKIKKYSSMEGSSFFKFYKFKGITRKPSKLKPLNTEISKCDKFGMRWKNTYELRIKSRFDNLDNFNSSKTNFRFSSLLSEKQTPRVEDTGAPKGKKNFARPSRVEENTGKNFLKLSSGPRVFDTGRKISPGKFSPLKENFLPLVNSKFSDGINSKGKKNPSDFSPPNDDLNLLFNKRILWIPHQFFKLIRTVEEETKISEEFLSPLDFTYDRSGKNINKFSGREETFYPSEYSYHSSNLTKVESKTKNKPMDVQLRPKEVELFFTKPPLFLQKNRQGHLKPFNSFIPFPSLLTVFNSYKGSNLEFDFNSLKNNNKTNNNLFNFTPFNHYKESVIDQSFGFPQKWNYCFKPSNLSIPQHDDLFLTSNNQNKEKQENYKISDGEYNFFPRNKFSSFSNNSNFSRLPINTVSNSKFGPSYFHFITFSKLVSVIEKKNKQTWLNSFKKGYYFSIYSTNTQKYIDSQQSHFSKNFRYYTVISNFIKKQLKKLNCFLHKEQLSLFLLSLDFKPSFPPNSSHLNNKIHISIQKCKEERSRRISNIKRNSNGGLFDTGKPVKGAFGKTYDPFGTHERGTDGNFPTNFLNSSYNLSHFTTNLVLKKGWVYLMNNPSKLMSYHKTILYPGQVNDLQLNASKPLYLECHTIKDIFDFKQLSSLPEIFFPYPSEFFPHFKNKKSIKNTKSRYIFSTESSHKRFNTSNTDFTRILSDKTEGFSARKESFPLFNFEDFKVLYQSEFKQQKQKRKLLLSYLNQFQYLQNQYFSTNETNTIVLLIQPVEEYNRMNSKELKTYVHESTLKQDSHYKMHKLPFNNGKGLVYTQLRLGINSKHLIPLHQFKKGKFLPEEGKKIFLSFKNYRRNFCLVSPFFSSLFQKKFFETHEYNRQKIASKEFPKFPTSDIEIYPMSLDNNFVMITSLGNEKMQTSYYRSLNKYKQPINLSPFFISFNRPMGQDSLFKDQDFYLSYQPFSNFDSCVIPLLSSHFSYFLHFYLTLSLNQNLTKRNVLSSRFLNSSFVEETTPFINKNENSTFRNKNFFPSTVEDLTQSLQTDFIPRLFESPCFCFQNIFYFKNPILNFENLQRDFFRSSSFSSNKRFRTKNKSTSKLTARLPSSNTNKSSTLFSYSQRNEMFLGVQPLAKTNIFSPFNGEVVSLNVNKGCMILTSSNLISYYLTPKNSSLKGNYFNAQTSDSPDGFDNSHLRKFSQGKIFFSAQEKFSPPLNPIRPNYSINNILVKFLNMTDIKLDFDLASKLNVIPNNRNSHLTDSSFSSSEDSESSKNYFKRQGVMSNIPSKLVKVSNLVAGQPKDLNIKVRLGDFCVYGDPITNNTAIQTSGQLIHYNSQKITLRRSQPIFISPKGILHKFDNDFIDPKTPVITLSYQKLKTGDIIQGIPKVEQFFEARTTKRGRFFRDSLPYLLKSLFKRYSNKLPLDLAVRQSFYKIQQILVDGVHRVYKAQGVTISDKHLEVIVKQMTSKVRVIDGAQTGFFPGEVLDLFFVEKINTFLMRKITYEPLVLGITKASLEVDSFLSAASFQQTTRVLSKAAIFRKKDFLKGLKENVILGNLIPAGTGFLVYIDL